LLDVDVNDSVGLSVTYYRRNMRARKPFFLEGAANLCSQTDTYIRDLRADLVRPQIASLSGQYSTAGSQKNG
jgi:hypothetical protein